MSNDYILLTGATGGTGGIILEHLLKAGHKVNAVVRSLAKAKDHLEAQYSRETSSKQLILTEIPDMAAPNAFHNAAQTSQAIIHAATPIAADNFEESMIKPTWAHLDNVLNAAAAAPSVKRVVITGTIVSVVRLPADLLAGKAVSEKDFNPITREEATSQVNAYQYCKVSSEQRAWAFMEREKPGFDMVYLLAPSIIGRSIQVGFKPDKTSLGGVSAVYRELFDRKELGGLFPYYMDVDDVATVHVRALDKTIAGGKRYLLRGPGVMSAAAAANEIRRALPQLKDRVPAGDESIKAPGNLTTIDTTNFDKAFGTQWKSWEGAIVDIAKDIVKYE